MFDNILSSLLVIVIVLDIVGAIAYFALGALRKQKRDLAPAPAPAPVPAQPPSLWQRIFSRRQPRALAATEGDFAQLHRVLYGFQDGLT